MSVDHDTSKHVDEIDGRLRSLRDTFSSLDGTDDLDDALIIIRRPGWTTPQEVMLVQALIDATQQAARQARQLRHALVEGITAIGYQG